MREISKNASLRNVNCAIVIHEIKITKISKNMRKNTIKVFTKINVNSYLNVCIDNAKWLTKKQWEKYASLIVRIVDEKLTNKLISEKVCCETNIIITEFYDQTCKMFQCLKCQKYDHKIYTCKNRQRCVHCAQKHRSKQCFHKNDKSKWKCEVCENSHKTFDLSCNKRRMKNK